MTPINQIGHDLIRIIDKLAHKKIQHWYISEFWNRFFLPHSHKTVDSMKDEEIKLVIDEAYDLIRPIYEMKQASKGLAEGLKLGSPCPALTPEIKKLLELEIDKLG